MESQHNNDESDPLLPTGTRGVTTPELTDPPQPAARSISSRTACVLSVLLLSSGIVVVFCVASFLSRATVLPHKLFAQSPRQGRRRLTSA